MSVTILFYKMFYYLEEYNLLDHLNEHHLWALHYIFIPRINRCPEEFTNGWNNHPIRTAGHKFPQQLFTARCLLLQNSQHPALDFLHSVDETYGIDTDGPLSSLKGVSVPQSSLRFSDGDIHLLKQNNDPCGVSDNYGIDLYEQTLHFISSFTQSNHANCSGVKGGGSSGLLITHGINSALLCQLLTNSLVLKKFQSSCLLPPILGIHMHT